MNTINTLAAWMQALSIAVVVISILVPVLRHQRGKLDLPDASDPVKRRRNIGLLIYGLSALLAYFYMINRNTPVSTITDLAAWMFVFVALSFLIWVVSFTLALRLLEKTS